MLNHSSLERFVRQQSLYLSIAAVTAAFFWGNGQRINPATIVVYSICFGNLITPPMERVRRIYASRPFPYNWLIFLGVLLLLTPIVYVVASVFVVWLAPPSPQSLLHLDGSCPASSSSSTAYFRFSTGKQRSGSRSETPSCSDPLRAALRSWKCRSTNWSAPARFNSRCSRAIFLRFPDSKSPRPGSPRAWWAATTSTSSASARAASESASRMFQEKASQQRCSWPMCRPRCELLRGIRKVPPAYAAASTACSVATSLPESSSLSFTACSTQINARCNTATPDISLPSGFPGTLLACYPRAALCWASSRNGRRGCHHQPHIRRQPAALHRRHHGSRRTRRGGVWRRQSRLARPGQPRLFRICLERNRPRPDYGILPGPLSGRCNSPRHRRHVGRDSYQISLRF